MDIYVEQMVKKRRNNRDYLFTSLIILGVFAVLFVALWLLGTPLATFSFLLVAAGIYGAYRLISAQKIEYEYLVTNGHIDIDMIIAQRKRKRIVSVPGGRIDELLPYDLSKKDVIAQGTKRVIVAAPSIYDENLWYYKYSSKKNGKTLVIFQPNKRVMSSLQTKLTGTVLRESRKHMTMFNDEKTKGKTETD